MESMFHEKGNKNIYKFAQFSLILIFLCVRHWSSLDFRQGISVNALL